ncbi:hypothetical protein A9Q84_11485 [Halobacteriovorax marinus]|uniref:DUF4856 domain-containing protein n=1 Tax=Halobacteriovorax marinus TaxID=97084 RepID=A0A1Y5FBX8_9BACT|nr:hypothetical protein A9Q84_11485 [Halobacteriovorax marinus]
MIVKTALLSLLVTLNTNATPLEGALNTLSKAPQNIKEIMQTAPKTYSYESQFTRSESVSYTGQAFRQILVHDIKKFMNTLKRGGHDEIDTLAALNSYFSYNESAENDIEGFINGDSFFKVTAKDLSGDRMLIFEGDVFSDVQSPGKNLIKKIAGNDNALRREELKGWATMKVGAIDLKTVNADAKGDSFAEPEDLVQALYMTAANNAENAEVFTVKNGNVGVQRISGAYITEDGLDLAQLTQKLFHGAVSFSQAARDYLSTDLGANKGLNADNTKPDKPGKAYTKMEHHFDEAFGYFGAARDYLLYSDLEIAKKLSKDTNGDGEISLLSEKNQGLSANFARMDLIAKANGYTMDLSASTMKAFTAGRNLITKKPANYKKYVVAQAQVALSNWERTLGALTVHYINSTLIQMNDFGTSKYLFKNHVKFWSEMKGFALSFQFSPVATMTDADFDKLHLLVGDKPALHSQGAAKFTAYKASLVKARKLLQSTYSFPESSSNW